MILPTPASADNPPPTIPGVDLLRLVGSGSHGQVWLGLCPRTRQLMAVKLIPLDNSFGRQLAARESAALAQLRAAAPEHHQNLIRIYAIAQAGPWHYCLMEPADSADGRPASCAPDYLPATLAHRITQGPIPPAQCLEWARQLLGALACLHAAGLTHRDVNPLNCLFVGGQLKLTDFSLMRSANPDAPAPQPPGNPGNPGNPEPPGPRADTSGAALVIFEMLTAQPRAAYLAWRANPPPPDSPPQAQLLRRLILDACSPGRFANAGAMLAAMHDGLAQLGRTE